MILASHQPDFMPWMGYFYKIFLSDAFVFSDNVLFSKTGRHDYNDVLTCDGVRRLKMPIHYEVKCLNEIKIAAKEYDIGKMLKMLRMEYGKASHFAEAYPVVEEMLMHAPGSVLSEFNLYCIKEYCRRFGLDRDRKFYISSELPLTKRRDERIIEMCKLLGADTYISGSGAKDYHVEQSYVENGITLVYSDYEPVLYQQVRGESVPNLSVIDYAMNCGFVLPRGWKRRG